ncbi:MAG TPA: Ig-like domain-containing protein, partial [Tepidisphaeraceae bacterium]|nr:Ig-like domain-containing protein [Tepidisphaeraceae bacterium]
MGVQQAILSDIVVVTNGGVAVENVTVDLTGLDGSPLTPQNFQIYGSDGTTPVQVTLPTATYLYTAAQEINFLNSQYGGNDTQASQYIEALNNQFNSAATLSGLEWLSTVDADFSGIILGNILTDSELSGGLVEELWGKLNDLSSSERTMAIIGLGLKDVENVINQSYNSYLTFVTYSSELPNFPINTNTLDAITNNTLLAFAVGKALADEASNLADVSGNTWADIKVWASNFLSALAFTTEDNVLPLAGAIDSTNTLVTNIINTLNQLGQDQTIQSFETDLNELSIETGASTFSFTNNTANIQSELSSSSIVATNQQQSVQPQPILSAKSTASTHVNTDLSLTSLFAAVETPASSGASIDHYNIINTLQGPGEIVIGGIVHTEGVIENVSPAAFSTAYFTASNPGTDEIALVAVDSAGNYSNSATTTITTTGQVTPPASTQADLEVSTASLLTSNLVSGGGGRIAYTVSNVGADAASSTSLSYIFLSTTPTLNSSAVLVSPGGITDAALPAGASQNDSLPFTLPPNIAGSYYLIVAADDGNQVAETNENNNIYVIPITVAGTTSPPSGGNPPPSPSGPNPLSTIADNAITTRVGSESVISSSALNVGDTLFSNDAQLEYTVVTPPAHGRLIDNFFTTSTFTQADVNNGLVNYVQDGTSVSSDSFSFYVTDPDGYSTPVEIFTFNILPPLNSPPPPPPGPPHVTAELANNTGVATALGPDYSTSDAALTGTADPNATVNIVDGSTPLGSATADSTGVWNFTPSGLAQGGHYIQATETNSSGQSDTAYLSLIYDTIAPPAPSAPQLVLGGSVTDATDPTVTGTAEAYDQVLLLEGNTIIGTGAALSNGSWTVEAQSLNAGTHSISAEAIDPAGNISAVSPATVIEIVPPPPGEVTLNDATMIAAGDLSIVSTVTDAGGNTLTEYGSITADGFSLTDTSRSAVSFITWDSGWAIVHNVQNVSEYYDGPDVLIVPSDGIIAPGSATGFNPVSPSIPDTIDLKRTDGSAFSLASIDIGPTGDSTDYAVFTGTTASGGTAEEVVNLNLSQNSPLQPIVLTGFNDVTDVKFTEHSSNSGDVTSIQFDNIVLGTAVPPPAPPPPASLTSPITLDDPTLVASGAAPLLETQYSPSAKATFYDLGSISTDGFTIANIDKSNTNPDGPDFDFSSYDSGWAQSESLNGLIFYDGANVLSVATGPDVQSVIQISRPDGQFFGIASIALDTQEAGDPVLATFTGITPNGKTVVQTFNLDNLPGMQTFEFDSDFNDVKSVQFNAIDTLQPLASPALQFNEVTLTPATPASPTLALSGVEGNTTNVTTPTFIGTGDTGDSITLYDSATTIGSTTVGPGGSWSLTPSNALLPGVHNLTASETDIDGNISVPTNVLSLTVNATPPTISSIGVSSPSGTDLNAGKTVSFTVNVSEAVVVSETPLLTLNDNESATYTGGSGTQALTFSYTVQTGDNTGDLQVTGINLNGGSISTLGVALNTANDTKDTDIVIDTTAPSMAITSSGGTVTTASQTIAGTGEAGTAVTVFDSSTQIGAATVNGSGIWSANVILLGEGANSITAHDTDTAGNIGTSTAVTYTLNTQVTPTITAVSSVSVAEGQAITASSLVASVSNPNADTITPTIYIYEDEGGGSGYFTVNGVRQADGQWFYPLATDTVQYVGGSSPGTDSLEVGLYDYTTNSYSVASTAVSANTTVSATIGTLGSDTFAAFGGGHSFNGNGGHDTLNFDGASSQYSFANNDYGTITITDTVADRDGVNSIVNVEFLQFTDKTVFVENNDFANIARLYAAAFDRAPDV